MSSNRYEVPTSYNDLSGEQRIQHDQYSHTYAPSYGTDFYDRQQVANPTPLWDQYHQKHAQRDSGTSWPDQFQWYNGQRSEPPVQQLATADAEVRSSGAFQNGTRGHGRPEHAPSALGNLAFASGSDMSSSTGQLSIPTPVSFSVPNATAPQSVPQFYHRNDISPQTEGASLDTDNFRRSWSKGAMAVPSLSTASSHPPALVQTAPSAAQQVRHPNPIRPSAQPSIASYRSPILENAGFESNTPTFRAGNHMSAYQTGKPPDPLAAQKQPSATAFDSTSGRNIPRPQATSARTSQDMRHFRASSRNPISAEVSMQGMRQPANNSPKNQAARGSFTGTIPQTSMKTAAAPSFVQASHGSSSLHNTKSPKAAPSRPESPDRNLHSGLQHHATSSNIPPNYNVQPLRTPRNSETNRSIQSASVHSRDLGPQLAGKSTTTTVNGPKSLQMQGNSSSGPAAPYSLSASVPIMRASNVSVKQRRSLDHTQNNQSMMQEPSRQGNDIPPAQPSTISVPENVSNIQSSSSRTQSSTREPLVEAIAAEAIATGTIPRGSGDEDMEAHIRLMVEKMREYQARDPAKFSLVWEQMKKTTPQNDTSNRDTHSSRAQTPLSPQIISKDRSGPRTVSEARSLSKDRTEAGPALNAQVPAPPTISQKSSVPEERSAWNSGVPSKNAPSVSSSVSKSSTQTGSHFRGPALDAQPGKQVESTASKSTDNRSNSVTAAPAMPSVIGPPQSLPPPTNPPQKTPGTIWPQAKKALLAEAAAKGLMAAPENSGKHITPKEICSFLDLNPSYIELCEHLEGKGFHLARGTFARLLLAAAPDVVSSSPGSGARGTGQIAPSVQQGARPPSTPNLAMQPQKVAAQQQLSKEAGNAPIVFTDAASPAVLKRGRGRPRKTDSPMQTQPRSMPPQYPITRADESAAVKRSRGRPRKYASPPVPEQVNQSKQEMPQGNGVPLPTFPTVDEPSPLVSGYFQALTPHEGSDSRQPSVAQLLQSDERETQSSRGNEHLEQNDQLSNAEESTLQSSKIPGDQQAGLSTGSFQGNSERNGFIPTVAPERNVPPVLKDPSKEAEQTNRSELYAPAVYMDLGRGQKQQIAEGSTEKQEFLSEFTSSSAGEKTTTTPFIATEVGAFSRPKLAPHSGTASQKMAYPETRDDAPLNGSKNKPGGVNWIPFPSSSSTQRVLVGGGAASGPPVRESTVNNVPKRAETPQQRTLTVSQPLNASTRALSKEASARKRTFNDIVDLSQDISDNEEDTESYYSQKLRKSDNDQDTVATRVSEVKIGESSQLGTPDAQLKSRDLTAFMNPAEVNNRFQHATIVTKFDKKGALRKSAYNPKTIARDVLLASGRHPSMRPLNAHFEIIKANFTQVDSSSDLSTFKWDLVDPGDPIIRSGAPANPPQRSQDPVVHGNSSMLNTKKGSSRTVPTKSPIVLLDSSSEAEGADKTASARPQGVEPPRQMRSSVSVSTPMGGHHGDPSDSTGTIPEPTTLPRARSVRLQPSSQTSGNPRQVQGQIKASVLSPERKTPASTGDFSIVVPSHSPHRTVNITKAPTAESNKKRKRQKPNTPNTMPDQPRLKPFKCQWMDCIATLHNIDTLRQHLRKTHCERALHGGIPCMWEGCGRYVPSKDTGRLKGRMELHNFDFQTEAKWAEHVEEAHLHEVSWQYGDGPASGRRDAGGSIDYLSDATGRQLTPQASSSGAREAVAAGLRPNRAFHKLHGNTTVRERMLEVERTLERKKRETGPGVDRGGASLFTQERCVWPADDEDFARECDTDEGIERATV